MTTNDQSNLMISISGMRGILGAGAQGLTPSTVSRFAAAVGTWVSRQGAGHTQDKPRVVLGRDARPSGLIVEQAAIAGLCSVGCEVICLGVASTPATAVMVRHLQADGGLVITASHNPLPWNGLKPLTHYGAAPPPEQAQRIIACYQNDQMSYADVHHLGTFTRDDQAAATHVDKVAALVDVQAIRGAGLHAVVDSVNGAGGPEAALLLERLGVKPTALHAQPTGWFAHAPEPTRENLTELSKAVIDAQADIGYAQDPDADRLAIVDETGTYIGEEYTLVLAALSQTNGLSQGQAFAANLSTSRMIDDLAQSRGGRVYRTPVGEANVTAAMREHDLRLGGEGNGGIIDRRLSQVRDSLIAMAYTLEMLAHRRQPLSQIVHEIPRYAIVKDKVGITGLSFEHIRQTLQQHYADQHQDIQDGIRIDWPDRWVHIRPSNTEPILRLIAEAADPTDAQQLLDQIKHTLGL